MKVMKDGSVWTDDGKIQLGRTGNVGNSEISTAQDEGLDVINNNDGTFSVYDNTPNSDRPWGDLPALPPGHRWGHDVMTAIRDRNKKK